MSLGMFEFVALIAALMAMNALSIDAMLPALPMIGSDLHVAHANDRQQIVTMFFLGLAAGSLIYGPLSDRYGRKPVLLCALALFLLSTLACALAPSFPALVLARGAAGFFAASCRVLTVSIVRDCFHGDKMARIMSFVIILFIIVPVLAPSLGTLVLLFAPWRAVFIALLVLGGMLIVWTALRLPETLRPENRVNIHIGDLGVVFVRIVTHRGSMGYMLASGIVFGALVGFVASSQQIFFDVFLAQDAFPILFAGIAIWMGLGGWFNGRLVERIGARRLAHSALALFVLLSLLHCLIAWSGQESLISFMVIQSLTMVAFSFTGSNLSAISMEPFARGAGLAASVQASLTTMISTIFGGFIGSHFDGTTRPLALGFFCCGALALLSVFWAERGKLFRRPGNAALRPEPLMPPPR